MPSIFLSYSRLDRGIVVPLAALLRGTSAQIFRDEESISPGEKWHSAIREAILSSDSFFVFWSAAAADSKSVQEECDFAIALEKRIVPVLLDDTPLAESLSEYQWVDLRKIVHAATLRAITSLVAGTAAVPGADAIGFFPFLGTIILSTILAYKVGAAFSATRTIAVGLTEGERKAARRALLTVLSSDDVNPDAEVGFG